MQVVTVRMDEGMVRKLEELAKLRRITRSALIKEVLGEALDSYFADPVRQAILALRQGKRPRKEIDWSRIEEELQRTEPRFPTVEEAIAYSRRRPQVG